MHRQPYSGPKAASTFVARVPAKSDCACGTPGAAGHELLARRCSGGAGSVRVRMKIVITRGDDEFDVRIISDQGW